MFLLPSPLFGALDPLSLFSTVLALFDFSMLTCRYPFQASVNFSSGTLPHIFYSVFHSYEQVCFDSWFHEYQSMIHWPCCTWVYGWWSNPLWQKYTVEEAMNLMVVRKQREWKKSIRALLYLSSKCQTSMALLSSTKALSPKISNIS